jgi:hypothetical protein
MRYPYAASIGSVQAVTNRRSRGAMRVRHSSSGRTSTSPTRKRLGFPDAVWFGARVAVLPCRNGSAGGSPMAARIWVSAAAGWRAKCS